MFFKTESGNIININNVSYVRRFDGKWIVNFITDTDEYIFITDADYEKLCIYLRNFGKLVDYE